MNAKLLREAATLMRERAEAAQHPDAVTPGVWMAEHHNSPYHTNPDCCHVAEDRHGVYWTVLSEAHIPIGEHVAGLDPHTALRIAAWLERSARRWWFRDATALAVARTYMGRDQ